MTHAVTPVTPMCRASVILACDHIPPHLARFSRYMPMFA
jgi:hypothetical protein